MRNDLDGSEMTLRNQLIDIVDVVECAVGRAVIPLGVTVTSKVWDDQVIVLVKFIADPVPGVTMILHAMNQEDRRCFCIAPVQIVKSQSLRVVGVRGGCRTRFE